MKYLLITSITIAFLACSSSSFKDNSETKDNDLKLSQETKEYWFSGEGAEITSYKLTQARYGELREGEAVTVFVSEPFSSSKNTKADGNYPDNVSVLKCNFTKRFDTGIYPYTMMNSTFYPFENYDYSLKVSTTVAEWCGHVYMELRNKKKFELENHSYFEGESFDTELPKNLLEDDLWSKIRLNPEAIALGKQKMIPSFFYMRLLHKEAKAYDCEVSLEKNATNQLIIDYPTLKRKLTIEFEANSPYKILGWTELYPDGFGSNAKVLETKGTLIKSIRSRYWEKHSNSDHDLRKELGLKL
jgi:hypothetical protein|tara:strand:- start:879 stop:1781 length:903 start_codon:yes stop_codon:yes gene_type:complete